MSNCKSSTYDKQMLKNNFEGVVRNYTMALLTAWDIDASDCYWVGNEVSKNGLIIVFLLPSLNKTFLT